MKKIAGFILLVVLLFAVGLYRAEESEVYRSGDYKYIVLADGTAEITKYTGDAEELVIPETLNGVMVTSIGDKAFDWCKSLTTVTIPDSVSSIGVNPFSYCTKLSDIIVSPDHLFLETIDGVLISKLDKRLVCFPCALADGSYVIPNEIQIIGSYSFSDCSLTSVTISDSIISIGENPFESCDRLTDIIVSPDHPYVTTIDGVLFSKLDKRLVCYPCAFTADSYVIPNGIEIIGDDAFSHCKSLSSVTIPDSVTSIGIQAFVVCWSLDSVTIPDSVISIGDGAFFRCESLTSVTISGNVTSIGNRAFFDCFRLTNITIPEQVTSIGDDSFSGCSSLTTIIIPDSVTSIGNSAFSNCRALATVTIPNGVISIGDRAFSNCRALISIMIPDSMTSIGNLAFLGCKSLKSVTLPESVITIGNKAFLGCDSLTVTVNRDSYSEQYCKDNGLKYIYPDAND